MRLVATADVFVQNYRPGVAERLGVGEARSAPSRPTSSTSRSAALARSGPYAQRPVYDPLIQGFSGLATVQAGVGRSAPAHAAHDPARQADRDHRLAGDHRGAPGARAHRRGPACPAVDARSGARVPVASDMGDQTFVGDEPARQEAASATDLIYETADGYITAAVVTNRQWEGADPGARTAGMARRRALQDAGAAPARTSRRGCR